MGVVFALVLAAATPVVAETNDAPKHGGGAKVSVVASAEILRAETSSPDPGAQGAVRQVRQKQDGRTILIEFF